MSGGTLGARRFEGRRSQERTDMIGAVRRNIALHVGET
jgi:hypothetical protein